MQDNIKYLRAATGMCAFYATFMEGMSFLLNLENNLFKRNKPTSSQTSAPS